MQTVFKPLTTLTAADLMSHEPAVIPRHMSLRTAAHVLLQNRVSGAPVVNARGECVGVLSASDFLQWAEGHPRKRTWSPHEEVSDDWQQLEPDLLPEDEVAAYMTADPVMADQATRIIDLARMMLDAHIHRVVIVDADRRPVGIVSSTDILAAVAQAEPN